MLGSDINEILLVLLGIDVVTPIVFHSFELIAYKSGMDHERVKAHVMFICYGHLFIQKIKSKGIVLFLFVCLLHSHYSCIYLSFTL